MSDDYGPRCGNCEWRSAGPGRCKIHKKPVRDGDGRHCLEHSVFFPRAVKDRFRREVLGERGE
jgi:hypothetical protein